MTYDEKDALAFLVKQLNMPHVFGVAVKVEIEWNHLQRLIAAAGQDAIKLYEQRLTMDPKNPKSRGRFKELELDQAQERSDVRDP